ncbi:uncharacterized protein BX663DRAFT_484554 [Cokeromyces recurvatus]|uniref:uncharacterized protein n=1 Tax=Cokeromyces recurvatus TaxID=90255 RepID=UPI00221F53E9|nr:uncharacterized protein BX663DRAFT_484554 [Cokeromyces recurvatus]KAI7905267.1 hypothetical protein BX663DRAFT_484554 [Cokeromyces recurvatus]
MVIDLNDYRILGGRLATMSILLTIQLGYLNLPFIIKRSIRTLVTDEEDEDEERIKPRWPFSQTMLSLSGFIQTLPHLYPTLENHILQLAPQSKQFEKETIRILSETFKQSSAQNGNTIHGVIPLDHELFGILSSTEEPTVFTLQIIEHNVV